MPNPDAFIEHLRAQGYHPRSDKHSNALAKSVVDDLLLRCPAIAADARTGLLVYDINFKLITGTSEWNIDLVMGQPPPGIAPPEEGQKIVKTRPSTIRIAIELKAVMTEHRKAVKNRKRDFEAHHDHVHRYNDRAIAGGVLIVNASGDFRSPLREEITIHRNPRRLVEHCVNEMRAVAVRTRRGTSGLDAKAVIVVDCNNVDLRGAHYLTTSPAPAVGDPLHYDAFLDTICQKYVDTFGPNR